MQQQTDTGIILTRQHLKQKQSGMTYTNQEVLQLSPFHHSVQVSPPRAVIQQDSVDGHTSRSQDETTIH